MTVTFNIPSQLPALTGNSLLYLRVNLTENGIEWAATQGGSITINSTAIASGTVNRVLFEGAGNVVQQDAGFVWNNTDKRLILGADQASVDTNPRLVVVGKNPSGTTVLAAFHNSTGNSNALVILENGNIGIGTNAPTTPITIGNPLGPNFIGMGVNTSPFFGRFDQNNPTSITLRNSTNGANAQVSNILESTVFGNPGQSRLGIAALSTAYTNEYFGGEGNSSVFYYKHLGNSSVAKMKFAISHSTDINNLQFEWIPKLQSTANNLVISGIGTVGTYTPVMTLKGNGNLLLGTTTDNPNAILNIVSTSKGIQIPRLTTTQRNAVTWVAGDAGMIIYNTTDNAFQGWNGTTWNNL